MPVFKSLGFVLLLLLAASQSHADEKGPEASPNDFIRTFLSEQPRFRVRGTFTIKKPGQPPIECGARLRFDRDVGAVFAYNTTGDEPEPYDFYFWNNSLALFVYNRDRTSIVKSELLGAPYRPAFSFIWDVLSEASKGAGVRTFLFSGLMRMEMTAQGDTSEITFHKRFGPISVEKISFTFDEDYRLRSMLLVESGGNTYSFKTTSFEKVTKKLPRPNIKKKSSPDW
jgi:hypothetical protein